MESGISKREFARKVIALSPMLKRTGEVPTESAIYNYLNGQREIKLELLPYFAEILNVSELELLGIDQKERKAYFKRLIASCTPEEKSFLQGLIDNKGDDIAVKIITLIDYAPNQIKDIIIEILENFRQLSDDSIKRLQTL